MRYRITGERNTDETGGRVSGTRVDVADKASEALAKARRFRADGFLAVVVVDRTTDEACDEAGLERAAEAEDRRDA